MAQPLIVPAVETTVPPPRRHRTLPAGRRFAALLFGTALSLYVAAYTGVRASGTLWCGEVQCGPDSGTWMIAARHPARSLVLFAPCIAVEQWWRNR